MFFAFSASADSEQEARELLKSTNSQILDALKEIDANKISSDFNKFKASSGLSNKNFQAISSEEIQSAFKVVTKDDLKSLDAEKMSEALQSSCAEKKPEQGSYLFLSRSIPKADVKQILEDAAVSGVTVVIRGMIKGGSIGTEMKYWGALMSDFKEKELDLVGIIIDPTKYTDFAIDEVPAIVNVNKDGEIAKATGVSSESYLKTLVEKDGYKDFGKQGATYHIEELDFIEALKSRAKKIDWEEKSKKAIDNFWKKKSFVTLPQAVRDRVYYVDISTTVKKDIIAKEGVVIAKKGQVFNPLLSIKLHKKYLVFNANSRKEVERVDEMIKQNAETTYILIATELEKKDGWNHLGSLQRRYNKRVYVLDDLMKKRFNLQHTLSVVEQHGAYLKVTEFGAKI
jgi:conjugal transfer pilus assembly protein TraW